MTDYVRWLSELRMTDVSLVGGKNASLGEMIHHLAEVGVQIPGGFATSADAYREFLARDGLHARIQAQLDRLDVDDVATLAETGARIRGWILAQPFQPALDGAIAQAYQVIAGAAGTQNVSWAVRSSATAEDLPDASFAGQQETFLNVHGLDNIRHAIKEVFASLFNDRAIAYRVHQGFAHRHVALSAGIQRMVRSDLATSGVMFSLDTESGFRNVVFITGSYGLGELVVQGAVNPDEFYVHKPTLAAGRPAVLRRTVGDKAIRMVYADAGSGSQVRTEDVPEADRRRFCLADAEVLDLARQAVLIEQHYGRPMDIEWAKDGTDGKLYIVQARPETVQSRSGQVIERYHLRGKGEAIATGRSIGHRIGAGTARVVRSIAEMDRVQPGDVLVADMTDPDWEPIMKRAAAIVTNRGGRTCFSGATRLLTNAGFITFRELEERGCEGLSVPSLNREALEIEWKPVRAIMKKTAALIRVGFSQTGRMRGNYLDLTPDHKMLNLSAAELVDTEIGEVLARGECGLVAGRLPQLSSSIATTLGAERDSIVATLLRSDVEIACYFLAGAIDGDGSWGDGRVNLYVAGEDLLEAVIVACLRIGTVPQVTSNRTIYNVQIVEQLDLLGRYTQRVKCRDQRVVGSRFFNARQVLPDTIDSDVNNRVRKNLLIDAQGLSGHLPVIADADLRTRLERLLASDLRQIRAEFEEELGEDEVYNITVADNHNYMVFTARYTPLLVNNCHAAIIARELGVPAVVGCNDATDRIADGHPVTVSCAEGDTGFIYAGQIPFEHQTIELAHMPDVPVKIMMNVGNPDRAFGFAATPNEGVGLARVEFVINNTIGIHPKALLEYDSLPADLRAEIAPRIAAYPSPREFYVAKLTEGIATLGAAFAPNPVIVRLSDFKSNEYANLIGGRRYEPDEENPMIGFRGAGRYLAESFRACFELECEALKRVRNDMGLTNVEVMIPFVRTVKQAKAVVAALAAQGLRRGENGLKLVMMCEIPSNALLAKEFLKYFDGFSIGSNDMTQLTLGLDRDSALVAADFDERDPAVLRLLEMAIDACRAQNKYIGICGQGPSDHPELADWLLKRGIGSISLNPDTVVDTWLYLAEKARSG